MTVFLERKKQLFVRHLIVVYSIECASNSRNQIPKPNHPLIEKKMFFFLFAAMTCERPTDADLLPLYNFTNATENLDVPSFSVEGLVCADGTNSGETATASACSSNGTAYSIVGCTGTKKRETGSAVGKSRFHLKQSCNISMRVVGQGELNIVQKVAENDFPEYELAGGNTESERIQRVPEEPDGTPCGE